MKEFARVQEGIEMAELDTIEISFINTIHFDRYKLIRIRNGSKATNHFSKSRRKRLVKQGILVRVYGRGGGGVTLSEKATQALNDIKKETPDR